MFLDNYKKIHLVGIGGIGVSAVAKLLKLSGKEVTGSDLTESEIVEELKSLGIKVYKNHQAQNLEKGIDLLIYSSAVSIENPERQTAKERGITEFNYFEFLGQYSQEKWTIAVSGTHGKSTTTAMLGLIAEAAGLDPTVIVGSRVKNFKYGNLRIGRAKYFIVEACEHMANMLHLFPQIIILTNIEEDHLDYYKNLKNILLAFKKYVTKLPSGGNLIWNADDNNCKIVAKEFLGKKASFGYKNQADFVIDKIKIKNTSQKYSLNKNEYKLKIPGMFNIYNASAASTAALILGISPHIIHQTLANFKGIWRRFEYVGEKKGALIYLDYGHHPTAIRETLAGARSFFPNRRLVLVFQPHHRSRVKNLFNQFVKSFDGSDVLILSEIFNVVGREKEDDIKISSKDLIALIKSRGKVKSIYFVSNSMQAKEKLLQIILPNDLVIIMGAGDIYKIANHL